jgi:hypothetical protein
MLVIFKLLLSAYEIYWDFITIPNVFQNTQRVSRRRSLSAGTSWLPPSIAKSSGTRTPIPAQGGQQSGDCGQQVMAV